MRLAVFASFGIANAFHHRVLYYGIAGAVVLRLVFILLGNLVNSPFGADFGKRLSTNVDTANTLIRFDINISRGRFIQARCKDRNKQFNFHYKFIYGDSGLAPNDYPPTTDTVDADNCKRAKRRRR